MFQRPCAVRTDPAQQERRQVCVQRLHEQGPILCKPLVSPHFHETPKGCCAGPTAAWQCGQPQQNDCVSK